MTVANEICCPNCFSMIPAEAESCPACGERIASLSARGYREKLLHALAHPLDDIRMRAIIALGLRRETVTAVPLAECALRHPTNVVEGMEVVYALRNVGASRERLHALAMLANDHAARAVRAAAKAELERNLADGESTDGGVRSSF